ncbi:hypothetical protein RP726_17920 [Candidatus Methylospira mobilis]|uniref:hypothetical protein n=1 Tax=Candidatus Methylospira mobilis TaxID=1808979 RepID=UPI0028F03B87|nr:hypothetical protein [Candidatus Methylospira mobilis]WNV04263.1 hypothetical protein RP726_17920 [Candidatus Methylospira mobilis]
MTLPGGASDKLGNRYEQWWTVSQLIDMLHGTAGSIRIEDPGVEKAEFVLTRNGVRELHQAKRSHPDGKWSLATLGNKSTELLQAIYKALSGNNARFVFVSSSDSPELRELAERARQAESVSEFKALFLAATKQDEKFKKLLICWGTPSEEHAHDVLRRIEVRSIDEAGLKDRVKWGATALFLQKSADVCNALYLIALDSVHQSITRNQLITLLKNQGYLLRAVTPETAPAIVTQVTDKFLENKRKSLIGDKLILREATRTLLQRIEGSEQGADHVLTGKAGVGKSGCVIELVQALREREIPVLAFRLDNLEPVTTTKELGCKLDLEESPALLLASVAALQQAVLVVDQLDAVSTTSGRNADFFDAVEALMLEVRALRIRHNLHVVLVCRDFDFENDHRLRQLLSAQDARIAVSSFSLDEVKAVLLSEHFRFELFHPRQLDLLRLPQNLALFLSARVDPAVAPAFNTAKELFDNYWETKYEAVNRRSKSLHDQWLDVIRLLCEEMTRTQQLSIIKEKLDPFKNYATQMASEGVLSFDGKHYGFGHESFFDYCFARLFISKEQSFVEYLPRREQQHLFYRAQLRQVLAYIRDSDPHRYCTELQKLLTDQQIRIHLKDLALAQALTMPDPNNDEWTVLEPWFTRKLTALAQGEESCDKLSELVWRYFFGSESWFYLADRRGLVSGWLASANENLIDMAVKYLALHQRHAGNRVAELLEPYVGKEGLWKDRLRHLMEAVRIENSRPLFNLFLRLLDDGTLDGTKDRHVSNGTFWSMLYITANAQPTWVPEIMAHWLTRRALLLWQKAKEDGEEACWHNLFGYDEFAEKHFHNAAAQAPEVFIQHVLPVVLEIITSSTMYIDNNPPPRRSAVWPILIKTHGYETIDSAYLSSLVSALATLAQQAPDKLSDVVAGLRQHESYIANYLLLSLYAAGAVHFADEAAGLLSSESWRFDCGYSDSPYWVAMQTIRAVFPLCLPENRKKLEEAIVNYRPESERKAGRGSSFGLASFSLLSAIPAELFGSRTRQRFAELQRKFPEPDEAPRGVRVYCVGSPIESAAATKMTDQQWLKAIAKYDSEERLDWHRPEKGGAIQLAQQLGTLVKSKPERFARLSLQFPAGTNPVYIGCALDGLKGTAVTTELKLAVCRKAYEESREECGKSIADLLGSIEDILPDDALEMLSWLATEHSDPATELWNEQSSSGQLYYNGDMLGHGVNTVRGRAAWAIRDLVNRHAGYISRLLPTIERMLNDASVAVSSCVALVLVAVSNHDMPLALRLLPTLIEKDERLLAIVDVRRTISFALQEHFDTVRPLVETMLRSSHTGVAHAGASLAAWAALKHEGAESLADEALSGNSAQRLGVTQVAAANLGNADDRAWCESHLVKLFDDEDNGVRREAARCFLHLEKESLENYEDLVRAFCDSSAYQEHSVSLIYTLENSQYRLPGITCVACEKLFTGSGLSGRDVLSLGKLIFRTYHQHRQGQWASRCLDLIDCLCLDGLQVFVPQAFDTYER